MLCLTLLSDSLIPRRPWGRRWRRSLERGCWISVIDTHSTTNWSRCYLQAPWTTCLTSDARRRHCGMMSVCVSLWYAIVAWCCTGMGTVKYRGITGGKTAGTVIRTKSITAVTAGTGTVCAVIPLESEKAKFFTKEYRLWWLTNCLALVQTQLLSDVAYCLA